MVKEKLDAIMTRNYMSSQNKVFKLSPEEINYLGKTEENILVHKQGIEISSSLPKSNEAVKELHSEKQSWAEELRAADERCEKYRKKVNELEKVLLEVQKNIGTLNKKVANRDIEIKRLQALYEGGQTLGKLTAKYIEETSEETVIRLTSELELLAEDNRRLDAELQKYKGDHRAAVSKLEAQHKAKASQLLEKNEKLIKKINELKITIEELKKDNTSLTEELNTLMQDSKTKQFGLAEQVKTLETEIINSQKDIANFNQFKVTEHKMLSNTVSELKMERDSLLHQNKELLIELEDVKVRLKKDESSLKGQLIDATKEIERSQVNTERAMNEIKQQAEECIQLRKELHDLGAELLTVKNERNNLKLELETQQKQKEFMEAQMGVHREDLLKGKAEPGSRFETLYNSAKTEIEYLKKKNQQLDQLLNEQNAKVAELSGQVKEYKVRTLSAEGSLRQLEQEYNGLKEQLITKATELKRLEINKEDSEIRSMEESALRERIRQLEIEVEVTKNLLNETNKKVKGQVTENIQLRTEIQHLEQENFVERTKVSKAKIAEQDSAMHKTIIETLQKKDIEAAKKLEEVQMKMKQLELENGKNKKKAEIALEHANELEEELKKKGEEIIELTLKLDEYERDVLVQEGHKKELKSQSEGIQHLLVAEQGERERLEDEIKDLQKELTECKTRETVLNKQVNELKALIDSMNDVNNELMEHMNKSTQSKKNEELILMQQVEQLRGELASKENELVSAKMSIEQLDTSLNQLQAQLDTKAEECQQYKVKIEELNEQLKQHASNQSNNKQILKSENEVRELRERLIEVSKELEDAKEQLEYKERQVQELNEDLKTISRENQYVNAELNRLSKSQNNLKQITEEWQFKHQSLRPAEYNKEDIIPQMEHIKEIVDENKALHAKLQEMNIEMGNQEARIEELVHNEQNYIVRINKLIQEFNFYKESQQVGVSDHW